MESKIEAVLFFKSEPVTVNELCKILDATPEEVRSAIQHLEEVYKDRGIVIVNNGESITFGTNPEFSTLIESLQKEELSRDLSKASLETLSIILYKSPITRREIDQIRGVNSAYIVRSLMIRGLVERDKDSSYKPTLKLLEHLGVSKTEDLPEYKNAFEKIEEFMNSVKSADVGEQ